MLKKIISIICLSTSPLVLTGCFGKQVEPFDNVYGIDVYDVMEVNDTVILELEITELYNSSYGGGFHALDSNGVTTREKSEEILGSPSNHLFYSIPSGFIDDIRVGETYYITFAKKLNYPNTFPQFGLVGDNADLDNDNFNYDGYYCNVEDISNCYKVPATTYDLNEDLLSFSEIVDGASDIARVVNTEGVIIHYDPEKEVPIIDEDGNNTTKVIQSNIVIENNGIYLTLSESTRENKNHDTLSSELILNNKYIVKFVIRSSTTHGTGTESDPYVIDSDIARTTERLQ